MDQLERKKCLTPEKISSVRQALATAERGAASARQAALTSLSSQLSADAQSSCDNGKVQKLLNSIKDLSAVS